MLEFDFDNMYCGVLRRGDVVIYGDDDNEKRGAVILQDNVLNDGLPTVLCADVESLKIVKEVLVGEVLLRKNESGLGEDSVCLLHKIHPLKREVIIAKKGELSPEKLAELFEALDVVLGRFR